MATETENQIVVYQPNETIRLDVRLENETVWLTQEQMCELFQREYSVITKHIRNVFSEGECVEKQHANFAHKSTMVVYCFVCSTRGSLGMCVHLWRCRSEG